MAVKDLIVRLLVDDKETSKFTSAGDKAGDLNKKLQTGANVVGAALIAGAGVAVAAGEKYNDAAHAIAQGTGAQGDALDGLVDSARRVAESVPTDIGSAGDAVADLNTRLGLTGEPLETMAAQILRLGEFSGQEAVNIGDLTGALNLFRVPVEEMPHALDTLYGVSQATGVSVNALTAQLAQNGSRLQMLGFDYAESAQLLGTLDKAGLDAAGMASTLGGALTRLAEDGKDPQVEFRRVIEELDGLIAAGDTAGAIDLASGIFGTRNADRFVTAVQSGSLNLEQLTVDADGAAQSILEMGESTDSLPEKWQMMETKVMGALADIGEKLIPVILDGLDAVMPVIDWIADNTDVVLWFAGALGVAVVAVKGMAVVQSIGGMLAAFRGVQVASTAATTANTAATWANNAAWLASPVTWIIAAIVAAIGLLVAAGIWLWQNWDDVTDNIGEAWSKVQVGFEVAVQVAGHLWQGFLDLIGDGAAWLGDKASEIVGFFLSIPERIGEGLSNVGQAVHNAVHAVATGVAWLWNNTVGRISFEVPGWVPFIGGNTVSFPTIEVPALAAGGIVTEPTLALIGEAGPEAVIPLSQGDAYGVGPSGPLEAEVPLVLQIDGNTLLRVLERVQLRAAY